MLQGYQLCAATEGKSPNAIAIVTNSVHYFLDFLDSEGISTDAEACAYLYTASLTQPMGHDWTQIYLYIATKVYEKWRTKESGVTMPEDIRVETLNDDQMRDLNRLKAWLYRKRTQVREERDQAERR